MSPIDDPVSLDIDGDIATVTIERPEAMNAVNVDLLWQLAEALEAGASEAKVIVLTGAGDDAFIGGGDIKDFTDRSALWFEESFRESMRAVEAATEGSRVPVIAAVDGVALGGGTEIALMCDIMLASESAQFGLPEIGLGIIPGSGGTQRLSHQVGYLTAKEIVLTGRHLSAAEAENIGLITDVVPDEEFEERVDELARDLAGGPQVAHWFAKQAINRTRGNLESGLELEAALAAILFETDDGQEGLAAFTEKRTPEFD